MLGFWRNKWKLKRRRTRKKLSHLEDENHVLRQKALTPSPKSNRSNFLKSFSDIFQSTLLRTSTSFGGVRLIYLLSRYIKDSLTHTKPDSFLLFL
ncbi:hypothetical protein E1A91_A13G139600v1 [Gossypium mustelinum]|uniref:Uncharacterized protein n=1 Tax=Gossypium mustelinum TaxID=34275 RepID=A0A5D2WHW2_GOSMU|nr:hypothetical protein E1A91_A13G139600v1 [Gossypium mustelinum]